MKHKGHPPAAPPPPSTPPKKNNWALLLVKLAILFAVGWMIIGSLPGSPTITKKGFPVLPEPPYAAMKKMIHDRTRLSTLEP